MKRSCVNKTQYPTIAIVGVDCLMDKISIIIRTKNEENWIGHCLTTVFEQNYNDFEVIVVDNNSTDHTVDIAKRFPVKRIISISEFKPGKAINDGVRASEGQFLVCLSAHCIPKDKSWLSTLKKNFDEQDNLAGVYGMQLPVNFTDPLDKRDLLLVFGQDKRVQKKDYFFHNANSMISRDVWDAYPFDESVTNIEDRVWGKQVTDAGFNLVYEPEAGVYHYHGLHQGNDVKRAKGVASILERVDRDLFFGLPQCMMPGVVNVSAIVPIRDQASNQDNIAKLVDAVSASKYLTNAYFVSVDQTTFHSPKIHWIDRNEFEGHEDMNVETILKCSLLSLESKQIFPHGIMYFNAENVSDFDPGLIDEIIYDAQFKGADTVFSAAESFDHVWVENKDGDLVLVDESLESRTSRKPLYRALYGLGCFTTAATVRQGKLIGNRVGIVKRKIVNKR